MRFLANENFPLGSVTLLRSDGHDVTAVIEVMPGATDVQVLGTSAQDNPIILTFDRDYGELIFHDKQTTPAGVIYFRFDPITPEEPAELLSRLLELPGLVIQDRFTVVDRRRVRQRTLP